MARKNIEKEQTGAMPVASKVLEPWDVLARCARARDFDEAAAMLAWINKSDEGKNAKLGPASMGLALEKKRQQAQSVLRGLRDWARYSANSLGKGLALADKLMESGADPFAFEESGEKDAYPKYDESFFETLVQAGFWTYARALSERSEPARSAAKAAMGRMNAKASTQMLWGTPVFVNKFKTMLLDGGPQALELGFKLGLDPNSALPGGSPWIFACKDGASMSEFIKAGADVQLRNIEGKTLEESLTNMASVGARQDMLAMLKEARSKSGSAALDSKATLDTLLALSASAGWREFEKTAKTLGLDPLALRDAKERPLLAGVLSAGNWPLARELMRRGADPQEPSGPEKLPVGIEAFWAKAETRRLSPTKKAQHDEVLGAIVKGLEYGKTPERSERLLEAAVASKNKAGLSYSHFKTWLGSEPMDDQHPMWERLADVGQDPWIVRMCALERPSEPWLTQKGTSLLSFLVHSTLPKSKYEPHHLSWESDNGLVKMCQSLVWGKETDHLAQRLFEPAQWEAAFSAFWAKTGAGGREPFNSYSAQERLMAGLKWWEKKARSMSVRSFDMGQMSKSLMRGLDIQEGESSHPEAMAWIESFASTLCLTHPKEAGGLFLDILGKKGTTAACQRIWNESKRLGIDLVLPDGHALLALSGTVDSDLANHPLWRQIEESLIKKSIKPAVSATRRL